MDEPHRHRALAHRGSDSLDRATAHVTSGEYARQTRLQKIRFSRKSLPNGTLKRRTLQRPARQDEAAFVEFDGPLEPVGVGLRTDEDEEGSRPEGSTSVRAVVPDHEPFKAL